VVFAEVSKLSAPQQTELLRALRRNEPTMRCVATTSVELGPMVDAGSFNAELFDHLSGYALVMPGLRDRRSDIPLLARYALRKACAGRDEAKRKLPEISAFAMQLLRGFYWPGHVAQLMRVIGGAAIRSRFTRIEAQHLPDEIRQTSTRAMRMFPPTTELDRDLPVAESAAERAAIVTALVATGGVRSRAADLLGMGRTTLWRKLKMYRLLGDY
jgi:two-component system, NtrC family, response regulator AtoC